MTHHLPRRISCLFLFLLASLFLGAVDGFAQGEPGIRIENHGVAEEELGRVFESLDPARIPTGLLHDQVGSFVEVTRFDGTPQAGRATLDEWRQLYHELSRSSADPAAARSPRGGRAVRGLPSIEAVNRLAERYLREGLVPLAVLSIPFNKIRPDALERGLLTLQGDRLQDGRRGPVSPYTSHLAFAAAAYQTHSSSRHVRFVLPSELSFMRGAARGHRLTVDFGDGRGAQAVQPGAVVPVMYDSGGEKTITVTASQGNETYVATTTLAVATTTIPAPDLSWTGLAADRSYAGAAASYDAYVFFGAGNTRPTRPVVFVEGFDPYYADPAKRRTWQDIYEILLQQDFVNRLRSLGYDAVIMKLGNATDYVQRNAFALEHLLGRLNAEVPDDASIVVVGPSMGGLIGRYALAYMEQHGLPHNVRLFASLDAPHREANFPLGTQFFFEFFNTDSEKAQEGKNAINTVAARQMLAYQYRSFPYRDPLRTTFMGELNGYGFPQATRNIAVANGSGEAKAQQGNARVGYRTMQPGDKIIEYRYRSWYVDLDGDVWALPNISPTTQIFEGLKNVIGPHYRGQDVYVYGTLPYDNAPGGTRSTQAEIADSDVRYGDIRTGFPDHDWIPTTSALNLATDDLFYHVRNDPDGLTTSPTPGKRAATGFDAIYYPADNQEHIFATEENVRFLLSEIDAPALAGPALAAGRTFGSDQADLAGGDGAVLTPAHPNPFGGSTVVPFSLSEAAQIQVAVYDVVGRRVAVLAEGLYEAGTHRARFDGSHLAPGLYVVRAQFALRGGAVHTDTQKLVLLK